MVMGPSINLGYQFRVKLDPKKLFGRVRKANKKALREVAKLVQREARNSIKRGRGYSLPGNPPFLKTGNLKRSIKYKVSSATAWIGATVGGGKSGSGYHGAMLEHGTKKMRPRSFMGPARTKVENRLPSKWRNQL